MCLLWIRLGLLFGPFSDDASGIARDRVLGGVPPGESSRIGETTRFYRAIYANAGRARTRRFH